MLRLSDLVGSEVRSREGVVVGHLRDVTVLLDDDHPAVRRLIVGRRRGAATAVAWTTVTSFEHDGIQLSVEAPAEMDPAGAPGDELLLARDVLDTQIVDLAGRRMARVAEVYLARSEGVVRVAGVEVGGAGVFRRLGLRRTAERTPEQLVDWAHVHLTSAPGHALALATPAAAVHRLTPAQLTAVVAHLPTGQAADVLAAVPPAVAAGALSGSKPSVGARLLEAVPAGTGSSVVAEMAVDDAAAVLRGLSAEAVEALLANLRSERAATLRRLLAHPAGTAGGLMNSEVLTAAVGEPVESIRARVAADLPELEGLATVFVVDGAGRPVGSFEPNDLLAGRPEPRPVPAVPVDLPADRVIDLFALQDYLALPVVTDDGRLAGVVAVDDVLEELLAERLPGRARYHGVRRRDWARRLKRWSRRADR